MVGFNPLNVGRSMLSKARSPFQKFGNLRRQLFRKSKKTRRTPKTLAIPKGSQNQNFFPRFNMSPFPSRHRNILSYTSDRKTLNGTVGGLTGGVHEWGLNCLFDPDITGVGHQPMGFDETIALWKSYKVTKVDFKIRCFVETARPYIAAQVTSSQAVANVSGKTYGELNERTGCAVRILGEADDSTIYGSFDMASIEGQSIIDDNYGGSSAGNPANKIKLTVTSGDASLVDVSGMSYYITLNFHVQWHNRQVLTQS